MWSYRYLFKIVILFPSDEYPGVRFLNHIVALLCNFYLLMSEKSVMMFHGSFLIFELHILSFFHDLIGDESGLLMSKNRFAFTDYSILCLVFNFIDFFFYLNYFSYSACFGFNVYFPLWFLNMKLTKIFTL